MQPSLHLLLPVPLQQPLPPAPQLRRVKPAHIPDIAHRARISQKTTKIKKILAGELHHDYIRQHNFDVKR